MFNITMEVLDNAEPGAFLAEGSFVDQGSTNMCGTGRVAKWVAVRG
jgi:hypothetical protein